MTKRTISRISWWVSVPLRLAAIWPLAIVFAAGMAFDPEGWDIAKDVIRKIIVGK